MDLRESIVSAKMPTSNSAKRLMSQGSLLLFTEKKVTAPVQTADAVTVNVTENVTLNKMEKLVYQLSVAGFCGAFCILRLQELLIEFFMTRINMKKRDNNCNKITTIRPL